MRRSKNQTWYKGIHHNYSCSMLKTFWEWSNWNLGSFERMRVDSTFGGRLKTSLIFNNTRLIKKISKSMLSTSTGALHKKCTKSSGSIPLFRVSHTNASWIKRGSNKCFCTFYPTLWNSRAAQGESTSQSLSWTTSCRFRSKTRELE